MPRKTKHRTLLFFSVLCLLAFRPIADMISDTPSPVREMDHCWTENRTFTDGEEITYKLYYQLNFMWIGAGEVVFRVEETEDTYRIIADGRTISTFEWFYKVRDHYETIVDKETLLPIEFIRDIHEGKFKLYNKFVFDQENKKVTSYKGRDVHNTKIIKYELSDCMHDMMSILYRVRNMNFDSLAPNDLFPIQIFLEEEYPLDVKVFAKDEVKKIRNMGKFYTHGLSPEVLESHYFNAGTEMKVWVSADKNHLPLMIESPVSVGSVKAVLKDYKGLRHPFDSKYQKQ